MVISIWISPISTPSLFFCTFLTPSKGRVSIFKPYQLPNQKEEKEELANERDNAHEIEKIKIQLGKGLIKKKILKWHKYMSDTFYILFKASVTLN